MKYPNNWGNCPSNFILENSLDGINWILIDEQKKINFTGKDFKQNLLNSKKCYFIRIKNIGKNVDGENFLIIPYIEFFGNIYE